jgi:hypothetical protein
MAGPEALTANGMFGFNAIGADAICILYLDHQSVAPIRFAVRRLRKKFPHHPIGVCLWAAAEIDAKGEAAGADATFGSLQAAINFCVQPSPLEPIASVSNAPAIRLVAS